MSDAKPNGLPQWQRQDTEDNKVSEASREELVAKDESDANDISTSRDSRSELVSQAAEFLKHDDIKDESIDRKVSFLESKGLTNAEIQSLLGISHTEATSSTSAQSSETPQTTTPQPSPPSAPSPSSSPPIITYPEFLLHTSKPPPLVTTPMILNTLYATSVVCASAYFANKLLFTPMLSSLTNARHSLFSSAQENLTTFNSKLSSTVSTIPAGAKNPHHDSEDSDAASNTSDYADSDPTELFHRDAGVQTSLPTSPTPSSPLISTTSVPSSHANALQSIHTHLSSLSDSTTSSLDADVEARARISELQEYLEDMAYGRSGAATMGAGAAWNREGKAAAVAGQMDEIAKLKAEVRSFKGLLLSARSFPAGQPAVGIGGGKKG